MVAAGRVPEARVELARGCPRWILRPASYSQRRPVSVSSRSVIIGKPPRLFSRMSRGLGRCRLEGCRCSAGHVNVSIFEHRGDPSLPRLPGRGALLVSRQKSNDFLPALTCLASITRQSINPEQSAEGGAHAAGLIALLDVRDHWTPVDSSLDRVMAQTLGWFASGESRSIACAAS